MNALASRQGWQLKSSAGLALDLAHKRYQWVAEPQWMRSHMSMPSISSLVSSKGRLFTVEDRGSAEHPALPGKFALVARDAFNGILLWQQPFPDWHPSSRR